jgi:hypothetical protein
MRETEKYTPLETGNCAHSIAMAWRKQVHQERDDDTTSGRKNTGMR